MGLQVWGASEAVGGLGFPRLATRSPNENCPSKIIPVQPPPPPQGVFRRTTNQGPGRALLEGEGGHLGSPRAVAERSQGMGKRLCGGYWRLEMRLGLVLEYGNATFGGESGPECWGGGGGPVEAIPWGQAKVTIMEKNEFYIMGILVGPFFLYTNFWVPNPLLPHGLHRWGPMAGGRAVQLGTPPLPPPAPPQRQREAHRAKGQRERETSRARVRD